MRIRIEYRMLLLLIAVAAWAQADAGQIVTGQDGSLFQLTKFRAMCVDAEKDSGRKNWSRLAAISYTSLSSLRTKSGRVARKPTNGSSAS